MKKIQLTIPLTILSTLLSLPLMAENNSLDIGAIVISGESIYVDGKTKTRFLPKVSYQNELFFVDGVEAGGFLLNNERLKITGSLAMDSHDTERGDSLRLSDMTSLDRAVDVKLGAVWRSPSVQIKANVRRDIAAHKGLQSGLELSKPMLLGNTKISPFIDVNWMSADTVNYYYGVSPEDAKSGRSIYKAKDSFVISAGVKVMHPIAKNLNILGLLSLKQYDREITDSPIIENGQSVNIGLGLIYNF